jgi:cytochrome c5
MLQNRLIMVAIGVGAVAAALAACGPTEEELQATAAAETAAAPTPIPDAARGAELFENGVMGVLPCAGCHRLDKDDLETVSAPGLKGIADRAATRVPGMSAEEYLRQETVDPEAYIVQGTVEGDWQGRGGSRGMPTNYGTELSEADINDLIAFMLTLSE